MKFKRIFLMVLDSLGVGETTDAINFDDVGANTLGHINEQCDLFIPNLTHLFRYLFLRQFFCIIKSISIYYYLPFSWS